MKAIVYFGQNVNMKWVENKIILDKMTTQKTLDKMTTKLSLDKMTTQNNYRQNDYTKKLLTKWLHKIIIDKMIT